MAFGLNFDGLTVSLLNNSDVWENKLPNHLKVLNDIL